MWHNVKENQFLQWNKCSFADSTVYYRNQPHLVMFRSVFLETKYEPNIGFLLTPNNNNKLSTVSSRAFPVAGLQTWNDLPEDVTSAESMATFYRLFKTHLFRKSFPDYLLDIGWLDLAVLLLLRPPKNWLIDLSITSTTVVLGKIRLPVFMQVHTAYSGRVSIQSVDTLASVSVPHLDGAISWTTDDGVTWHLWRPYSTGVTDQRPQALTTLRQPPQLQWQLLLICAAVNPSQTTSPKKDNWSV